MNSETIRDYLLEKLNEPGYTDLKGCDLKLHIPVKAAFVNFALRTMVSTSEQMKDFREIVFSELENNRFVVKVNHKMLKKTIRCEILDIQTNRHFEQELSIEFLEGVKFYEKLAVNTFNTFRKGWSRFKAALRGTESKAIEGDRPFWKLTGSHATVNINALLRKQDLGFLAPALRVRDITTKDNKFVFDLTIKT